MDCSSSPTTKTVAVLLREPGDDLVLREAQVLELVHQDGVPAGPDRRRRGCVASEQLAGEGDEVVVVEQVPRAGALRDTREELAVARREGNVLQPVSAEEPEELGHGARPHPESPQHSLLVVLVRDTEALAEAHERGVFTRGGEAQRVEGYRA